MEPEMRRAQGRLLKADTRPWMQSLGLLVLAVLLLGLGNWVYKGAPLWLSLIGSVLFYWVFGGWHQWKELRRAEQRRQAAVRVPQWVPLARHQPSPDPAALLLPFVFSSKPRWLSYPLGVALLWVIILIFLLLWFWPYAVSPFSRTLLFSVTIAFLVSIVAYLAQFEWIEAREEGLTIRTLFYRKSIPWQEARLFAIDAMLKPAEAPNRYELSSATTILRWSRALTPSRWTRLSSPFEEYSRQMDALLALIAGRTGLPLRDLRDWRLPPLPPPSAPGKEPGG